MEPKDEKDEKKDKGGVVEVPLKLLTQMQEQMAELERKVADGEAKAAGLEEIAARMAEANGEKKEGLRERKTFEPKFRTLRLRRYPIKGEFDNKGLVVGWTNRGAYQTVDKTGVTPIIVDMIDIVFLGQEKDKSGKLQAEQVKLLDLMNKGEFVHCKILEIKKENMKVPTNEEIDITMFDPAHGLVQTGEKIDGYFAYDELKYKIQVPGLPDPIWIDAMFANV